ncbi:MAG: DUF5329 domain-containing protein [Pseudomonadota bacterium]
MKSIIQFGLVAILSLTNVAYAQPPVNVQIEVSFLLGYIEGSDCEFYRNGAWKDAKVAQAHIRDKYNYLVARNLIHTTEEFIERAATESSFSGQAYKVRCKGGAIVTSKKWLSDELSQLKTYN